MNQLSRRATSGTEVKINVPDMAQIHENPCQNTFNLAQNSKKPLCHSWHKNILKVKNLQDAFTNANLMINSQFYLSNHRCEVCGRKTLLKTDRDKKKAPVIYNNHRRKIMIF